MVTTRSTNIVHPQTANLHLQTVNRQAGSNLEISPRLRLLTEQTPAQQSTTSVDAAVDASSSTMVPAPSATSSTTETTSTTETRRCAWCRYRPYIIAGLAAVAVVIVILLVRKRKK